MNHSQNCIFIIKFGCHQDETISKKLIRLEKSSAEIEFVCCTASHNEVLDLIKVNKQRENAIIITKKDFYTIPGDTKSFVKSIIRGL